MADWVSAVAGAFSALISMVALFVSIRTAKKSLALIERVDRLQVNVDSRSISTGGGGGGGIGARGGDGGSVYINEPTE